jgi:hypothetical protein
MRKHTRKYKGGWWWSSPVNPSGDQTPWWKFWQSSTTTSNTQTSNIKNPLTNDTTNTNPNPNQLGGRRKSRKQRKSRKHHK